MSEGAAALTEVERSLVEQVVEASASATPLRIQGGGSKTFYGRDSAAANSRALDVGGYRGVLSYEPTELVITAAAATPLVEIEAALAARRQMLGFEPPRFDDAATIGGVVACGLSGPRRPFAGSARDFVLGVKIINGRGEVLSFGGQVMKNVAGYDLSRLMTGALGTLGVILEVSLRVLPVPAAQRTLTLPLDERAAIVKLAELGRRPLPLSAAAHYQDTLYLRLSGAVSAVDAAAAEIAAGDAGARPFDDAAADSFWRGLREQRLAFFNDDLPLWRLSMPPAIGPLGLPQRTLLDWGGAQRWLLSDLPAEAVFAAAATVGGHATLFRGGDRGGEVFQPLDAVKKSLHQRLKQSFDPAGIFNPGRLYAEL